MNSPSSFNDRGDISALTLFCQQADGSAWFPPLPKLAIALERKELSPQPISLFPSESIKTVNSQLQLDDDLLVAEPGYDRQAASPDDRATMQAAAVDWPDRTTASRNALLRWA